MTHWQRFVFAMRQFVFNEIATRKQKSSWNPKRFEITKEDLWWSSFLWKGLPFEDLVQFTERDYLDGWISTVKLAGSDAPILSLDRQEWPDEKRETMRLLAVLDEMNAGRPEGRDTVPLHEIRSLVQTDISWLVYNLAMVVYKFRDVFIYLFTDEHGVEHLKFRELTDRTFV
jgi:hypothetical protein